MQQTEEIVQQNKQKNEKETILLSFPRSGNHWVRFGIEWMTKRPTLGCDDNPRDIPISKNIFEENPLSEVSVGHPIATKHHYFKPQWHKENVKILCIIRDYRECVFRHAQFFDNADIYAHLRNWMVICRNITRFSGEKCIIYYEDLMSEEKRSDAWHAIGKFFNVDESTIAEFLSKHDHFSNLSKNATGRDWGGSISGKDIKFHQSQISPEQLQKVTARVRAACIAREITEKYT